MMYEELVKSLRICANVCTCVGCIKCWACIITAAEKYGIDWED